MRKMLLAVVFTVSFGIVQAQSVPTVFIQDVSVPTVTSKNSSLYEKIPSISSLLSFAKEHLSIRYRSGGTTTKGFDCSGFTRFCFDKFGISLPHSSAAQGAVGEAIAKDNAQPGDLILFKGHNAGGSRIGHVGMITEVVGDQIKFIHSAWSGGVRYDYLQASYYQRRFMGIRRVAHLLTEK